MKANNLSSLYFDIVSFAFEGEWKRPGKDDGEERGQDECGGWKQKI